MRVENWVERLDAVFSDAAARPFAWGSHDCCLFAARCVEAMTGEHPMPDAVGAYKTKTGAYRWLKREFGTVRQMLELLLDAPCNPNFAKRGDLALFEKGQDFAIGVIDLSGEQVLCVDESGTYYIHKSLATAFWTV